jgi:hypothetical protein
MKRFFIACISMFMLASSFPGTRKIPPDESIATIWIPDKWQSQQRGDAIEASPPDAAILFLVAPVEHNKVAEALGETMQFFRNRDEGFFVKPESRHDETGKVNGKEAHFVSWQGKDRKGEIETKFVIVFLAPNKSLIAAYDGSPAASEKYQRDLDKMIQSISNVEAPNERDRKSETENRK